MRSSAPDRASVESLGVLLEEQTDQNVRIASGDGEFRVDGTTRLTTPSAHND